MNKLIGTLAILFLLGSCVYMLHSTDREAATVSVVPSKASAMVRASLEDKSALIKIPVHEMVELDFKTQKEVYDLRKSFVGAYPNLLGGNYEPLDAIFGQIQDGRPWWGILGLSHYGKGEQSIEGPSEETRFLANPLLFAGLDTSSILSIDEPRAVYPTPLEIYWQADAKRGIVKYNITSYWRDLDRFHAGWYVGHDFLLSAYNARDFGYNYLYMSPAESENVTIPEQPTKIIEYIHTGGSCGYPGGCNNESPFQPGLKVDVDKLPALLYIKLWKSAPPDHTAPADMVWIIEMI